MRILINNAIFFLGTAFITQACVTAQTSQRTMAGKIIVAADASGDYRSIQGAISSLAGNESPRTVYIKNGISNEKICVEKSNIILEGESREHLIITAAIAREAWRGGHNRDARFYLVNCVLASNMKDAPIYLLPTSNTIRWGYRLYYYNYHREDGNDFKWHRDNLPSHITAKNITTTWLFQNKWKPDIN